MSNVLDFLSRTLAPQQPTAQPTAQPSASSQIIAALKPAPHPYFAPPGSSAARPLRPSATCKDARRLVPASVSTREPLSKSNAASVLRPASLAPGARQCSRPAIMRCSTSHRSPSRPMAMRLPTRLSSRTRRPFASERGGSAVRSRKGLVRRTPSDGPHDARFERGEVGGDIRQLGHPASCPQAQSQRKAALSVKNVIPVEISGRRARQDPSRFGRSRRNPRGLP